MSGSNLTLLEAERLHSLGFAIHWLMPKEKRPFEGGWTSGPRKSWKYLEKTYQLGLNVGVRTGVASKIGANYLACIDVDIKDPKYLERARDVLGDLVGDTLRFPEVRSGSGNGSRHLYCVTPEPFKMITIDKCKEGEIVIYSDGRQMALPPSIHPNGKPYIWKRIAGSAESLPVMDFSGLAPLKQKKERKPWAPLEGTNDDFNFEVCPVELDWLPISKKVLNGIKHGTGIEDRSGYLLPAATALYSAGLNQNEILTVLTDKDLYLGSCAFDHAKTTDRTRAAHWLFKYTVKRVISERSAKGIFEPVDAAIQVVPLNDEEAKLQSAELMEERDWRQDLARSGKHGEGPPKSTIENVVMILRNAVAQDIVRHDAFTYRDTYNADTPWGTKPGDVISDKDIPRIIYWLGKTFGFEPNENVVSNSLIVIAWENSFDPVKISLDALPAWDKVPRLDTWLIRHFEAQGDPEYNAQVFRKWLVAMVMRVYHPGSKFDWMPIFEGLQGIGKSSFGRLLVGDKYFLDWLPNLGDKDSALALQGMWGVEMGELSQFRKTELETIKSFLTRTVDKVRPPFGRRWLEIARRCVFFGTTNRETYLRDDTGNRRFKPLKVGNLDFEQLEEDRDQLFAEAKWLFDNFHETERTLDLTGAAKVYEAKIHAEKMLEDDSDPMMESIQDFVKKVKKGQSSFCFEKFRILDLFLGVGPLQKWKPDNRNCQFAAKALKKLGASKKLIKGFRYWELQINGEGAGFEEEPDTLDFR